MTQPELRTFDVKAIPQWHQGFLRLSTQAYVLLPQRLFLSLFHHCNSKGLVWGFDRHAVDRPSNKVAKSFWLGWNILLFWFLKMDRIYTQEAVLSLLSSWNRCLFVFFAALLQIMSLARGETGGRGGCHNQQLLTITEPSPSQCTKLTYKNIGMIKKHILV